MQLENVETVGGWITLTRYCELSGETRQSVHLRVSLGKWKRGVHYSAPDGGSSWVNLPAIVEWIKAGTVGVTAEEAKESVILETEVTVGSPTENAPEITNISLEFDPTKNFMAWLPALPKMEGDDDVYANMTGMDMPEEGRSGKIMGPHTKVKASARQFITKEDCQKWCDSQEDEIYTPVEVMMNYV